MRHIFRIKNYFCTARVVKFWWVSSLLIVELGALQNLCALVSCYSFGALQHHCASVNPNVLQHLVANAAWLAGSRQQLCGIVSLFRSEISAATPVELRRWLIAALPFLKGAPCEPTLLTILLIISWSWCLYERFSECLLVTGIPFPSVMV